MPLAAILRLFAFTLLLPLLAGCGPGRNEFPPACPTPVMPALTADVTAYRPGSAARDLPDMMFAGRMMGINGNCKRSDKGKLVTTVTFGVEVSRGPALRGNQVEVPVFVAVADGDQILDKRVTVLRGEFPPNVDRLGLTSGELDIVLPISSSKSGAAYSILAGFQLTPEQAAAARARGLQ